jgi:hypothetical protein
VPLEPHRLKKVLQQTLPPTMKPSGHGHQRRLSRIAEASNDGASSQAADIPAGIQQKLARLLQ